ncbi:MAG: hypothetical protein GY699_18945 [Desulfobacteraceae bacterium]|nr:hypothetical protein [Desulfobacteraceae bacterium]
MDKKPLINLLLECPSIRNTETRGSLLKMLPRHIVNHISVGNTITESVVNIVDACMNYSDGLECLFEEMRLFDEKTVPFQKLSDFLKNQDSAHEEDLHLQLTEIKSAPSVQQNAEKIYNIEKIDKAKFE